MVLLLSLAYTVVPIRALRLIKAYSFVETV